MQPADDGLSMLDYTHPPDDMRFVLENVVDLAGLTRLPAFDHFDLDTIWYALEEHARFIEQQVAPLNPCGDVQHSRWDSGEVTTPDGFREAYQKFVAAGWGGVPFPAEHGGGGFPGLGGIALQETMTVANRSFPDFRA